MQVAPRLYRGRRLVSWVPFSLWGAGVIFRESSLLSHEDRRVLGACLAMRGISAVSESSPRLQW